MRLRPLSFLALTGTLTLTLPAPAGAAQDRGVRDVSRGWWTTTAEPGADLSLDRPEQGVAGTVGTPAGTWTPMDLAQPWSEVGVPERGRVRWLRRAVDLEEAGHPEALLVGALYFGAYRLYVEGTLVDRYGEGRIPWPRPRVVRLAPEARALPRIDVALRLEVPTGVHAMAGSAPVISAMAVGPTAALEAAVERGRSSQRESGLATLLFVTTALVIGLIHLVLYATRTDQKAYLWFGLGCAAFAVNALALSPWAEGLTWATGLRLNTASGHAAAAMLLLTLWSMLDRRPSRTTILYVESHLVIAGLVLALPLGWVVASSLPRFLWLFPGLLAAVVVLGVATVRGHPDIRPLLWGGGALVVAEGLELVRVAGADLPASLPYLGFGAVLVGMTAVLARRFARTYAELDELRIHLERRVEERTGQFAAMTERAQEASEAKTRFVARLSHELRTPLNAIIGFAHVLGGGAQSGWTPGDRTYLDRIRSNGVHMLALVDDLLDVARIERGSLGIRLQMVDVGTLIGSILSDLGPQARSQDVRLSATVPSRLSPIITDPVRLRQILDHLLGNAIKFSGGGDVVVRVEAEGRLVRAVAVVDSGPGLRGQELARLTYPFAQADESDSRRHPGLGLGLAIARGLCDLLGYALEVDAGQTEGTTFRIRMGDARPPAGVPLDRLSQAVHGRDHGESQTESQA